VTTLDLKLPGRSMSAAHARLVRVGDSWALEDTGSKNGAFIDGRRVQRAVLNPGDLFEVGHSILRVNPWLATAADAERDADLAGTPAGEHATLDPAFARQLAALARLARSDLPILVLGETGTGKERLARAIHRWADRPGAFVAVNCGAVPSGLFESQLFGHVKGAFSGAVRDEIGFVRSADRGTLFLDEIGDLAQGSQASLLRVLQEREVVPIGSTRPVSIDVRIVAATHQPLDEMVARGTFRRDLFARVAGFAVTLPPLRGRLDDLGALVAALLPKVVPGRADALMLSTDVGRALLRHDWPSNIRELEQCLATCAALAPGDWIEREHLPPAVARALDLPAAVAPQGPIGMTERDAQLRLTLLDHLAACRGNLADVARAMGKGRRQVYRWCERFGVDPDVYRR
jgi:transcriptional regulator with PAS, ATPase and Fis domain